MGKLHRFPVLSPSHYIFLSANNVYALLQAFHRIGAFHLAAYEGSGKVIYIYQFGFLGFGVVQHIVHAVVPIMGDRENNNIKWGVLCHIKENASPSES